MFAYRVYQVAAFLAQRFSLPTARKLAAVVGRMSCGLQRRNRRHLLSNLEVAFGDERSPEELRKLRRDIYANFAVFVTDFLRLPLVGRDNVGEFLTEGSLERIREFGERAASGGPVISVTAHLGNWEFGAAATGLLGYPITALVDAHPSPLVTRFFDARREDKGIEVVPVSAFHRCFRAIKEGRLMAIVGDRPVTGQGVRMQHFGERALVPDGHAVLARRFGATLIPTFLVMTDDGRYEFIVEEPIVPRVSDDEEADVLDCVERCLRVMESYIRKYPEQWYVFRPIWGRSGEVYEDRLRAREKRAALRRRRRESASP